MLFHEQMGSFDLTVVLAENKLLISLEDYVDWVIYSKEYTVDNIGDEINRKMNLIDIYKAFSRTQPQEGLVNMK